MFGIQLYNLGYNQEATRGIKGRYIHMCGSIDVHTDTAFDHVYIRDAAQTSMQSIYKLRVSSYLAVFGTCYVYTFHFITLHLQIDGQAHKRSDRQADR